MGDTAFQYGNARLLGLVDQVFAKVPPGKNSDGVRRCYSDGVFIAKVDGCAVVGDVSVDLRAEIVGEESGDYRQGVAAFILCDTTGGTHMVLNILSMGDRFFAEHEVLAVPGQENPFTRMIEDPFFFGRAESRPDPDFRHCSIEIDRSRGQAVWKIDDKILHVAGGLTGLPEEVHMGFGVFTLVPIGEDGGSCHGQGARASWRNFEYSLAA